MNLADIRWLGHDGFRIGNLFIDPFKINFTDKADVILITHSHFDHCSIEDIQKLFQADTYVLCPPDCVSKLRSIVVKNLHLVKPGDSLVLPGYKIEVVSAYNTNKEYHPKQNEWVGYIITYNGQRIYHSGDTDFITDMKNVKCDIALLPVSGVYVMTAEEAVKAVEVIKPKLAIPMHYNSIVGNENDAKVFVDLCKKKGFDAVILNKE